MKTVKVVAFALFFGAGVVAQAAAAPTIGEAKVAAVGDSYAEISLSLSSFGDNATSATVTLNYGADAASLDKTYSPTTTIQATDTPTTLTLLRLTPERHYFVSVTVKNNVGQSVTSETLSLTTAASADASIEPGLNQTVFTSANGDWTKDYTTVSEGTDWTSYTDTNRIYRRELGAIAAYATASQKYTSEIWGDQIYWKADQLQWCYWGYMWMKKGTNYKFRAYIDDSTYIAVTDLKTATKTVLINDGGYSTKDVSPTYTPTTTGWYPIEIRLSDGSGGKGGCDPSSSCKNSVNLGYSADNGSTWNLMIDPGDGSLFQTGASSVEITATERVASEKLTLDLSFAEADADRTLAVVWGPKHGGETTNGWAHAAVLGTVAAGETKYSYAVASMSDAWGSDDNLVVRFCFVAGDAAPVWSNSTYWRDLSEPVVSDLDVDGTGGDTLVVKGSLTLPQAGTCTLTVLTGASQDALTQTWTGLDGATLSASGAFSLTLFEGDANSSRYLKPGETRFVAVRATDANGKSAQSAVAEVAMSGAAKFASKSASVSRRTVAFTGALASLGMTGSSTVALWVGEENDASKLAPVEDAVVVMNTSSFTVTHTFADFEKTYYWQFRATNASAGGTTNVVAATDVASVKTKDTTTYTWQGGASDTWDDAANWSDGAGGDSAGYPQSANAKVVIPKNTTATIKLREARTIGGLDLSAEGAKLTLAQGGTDASTTKLTVNNVNGGLALTGANASLTLDGVALATSSGDVKPGAFFAFTIKNGSDFYCSSSLYNSQGGTVTVSGGSTASVYYYWSGPGTLTLDDSTFAMRCGMIFYSAVKSVVNFLGAKPLLSFADGGCICSPNNDNKGCDVHFVFSVPAGGYATPPVQGHASAKYLMGNWNNSTYAGTIAIDVADDSPAKRADGQVTTTLVSWPTKGINQATVKAGTLPTDVFAPDGDAFVWDTENTTPLTLGVTLAGSSGANTLLVSGSPESLAADGLSPSVGLHAVEKGASLACSAPSALVQLSDTKRATCTGWKLYAIDGATRERTLQASGSDCAYTFANADGGAYELEWQWKIEYKVTATAGDHGSVAVSSEWAEVGSRVTVTPTADAGYFFGKWTGDVPDDYNKEQTLSFVVRDKNYSFAASFLPVVYVSTTGNDANGGTSWDDALASVSAALAKDTDGTGVCVMLADGVYECTAQIALTNGTTIAGANAGAKAVLKLMKTLRSGDFDEGKTSSFIALSHADARLYNVAVTTDYKKGDDSTNAAGAKRSASFERCVWLEKGGFVDHCVLTNGTIRRGGSFSGSGVMLNGGGVVRNSVISRNSADNWAGYGRGINVALVGGGLVENCTITSVSRDMFCQHTAASVAFSGGGTMRSSLIAYNATQVRKDADAPSAVYMNGGALENCTVTENVLTDSDSGAVPGVYLTGGATVRNCIIWDNRNYNGVKNWAASSATAYTASDTCTTPALAGDGNTTDAPVFADAAGGDFSLPYSACVDAGAWSDWMDWATDLAGNPRVVGDKPDLGCYEYEAEGFACGFDVATTGALDTDAVTLTAYARGGDLANLSYAWTLTDQDGNKITETTTDASVTLQVPKGRYAVALAVSNGAGATAATSRDAALVVHPSAIYVSQSAAAAAYPYDTPAKATASLVDALASAADGMTIHVAAGFYTATAPLLVEKGVTIVGDEGPEKTLFHCPVVGDAMVVLCHSDAVLSGLQVTGLNEAGELKQLRGGVRLVSGVVTNCWIVNHHTGNNSVNGAGIRMEGAATIVDCVISNNVLKCSGGWGGSGAGVRMPVNGLVDRCRFYDNRVKDGCTSYGGGIYLKAGVVRNSFFRGNYSSSYGGGIAVEGSGKVYNCTVVGNSANWADGGVYVGGNGVVRDCLVYDNSGGGLVDDGNDPGFADAANGDYRLSVASSAVDVAEGTAADLGDYDLEMNPRVRGKAADKGCYESDPSAAAVGITYAKSKALGACDVTFSVVASGLALDGDACYWTFDGSEPSAAHHDATGLTATKAYAAGETATVRFKTSVGGADYAVDRVNWFTVFGEAVYVVAENASPVYPYATWETAATNVSAALAAAQDGHVVCFGDGTFKVPGLVEVAKPLTITSANGAEKTVLDMKGHAAFLLEHEGALVSGLTVSNAVSGGSWYSAMRLKNGARLTDCVITHMKSPQSGGALQVLNDATVTGCRFVSCTSQSGKQATTIYADGANVLIDRCVIEKAYPTSGMFAHGAVKVTGGATLRNSVVTDCSSDGHAGVYVAGSGRVENCTVVGNTSRVAGGTGGVYVDGTSATVVNTVAYGNKNASGDSNIGGVEGYASCVTTSLVDGTDPKFKGAGASPFAPQSASPCVNKGTLLDWMTGSSLDVYGKTRLVGSKPDIGAAECTSSGILIFLR